MGSLCGLRQSEEPLKPTLVLCCASTAAFSALWKTFISIYKWFILPFKWVIAVEDCSIGYAGF